MYESRDARAGFAVTQRPGTKRDASSSPYEIRAYRDGDLPQVVSVLQAAFGGWPGHDLDYEDAAQFFCWKHTTSPFGRSSFMVADMGGSVVGLAGWMRWRLRVGGKRLEVLRGADLAVRPDCQGRGIHKAFLREEREHWPKEALFVLADPNQQSRPTFLRDGGGHEIGRFPLFVRVRRPVRAASRLLSERLRRGIPSTAPPVDAERAHEALRDSDGVSSLLAACQPLAQLATDRDLDYLRWKYGTLPIYRAVRVHRGARLAGVAIFRVWRRGPLWASILNELLVAPGDDRVAWQLLREVISAAPVDCVTGCFPRGSTARRAALRCGFVPTRSGPVPMIRGYNGTVSPDPTSVSAWALSLGDFDLV